MLGLNEEERAGWFYLIVYLKSGGCWSFGLFLTVPKGWTAVCDIRESPPIFENRIMARVYARSITRSTMYQKLHFVSRNWRMEN